MNKQIAVETMTLSEVSVMFQKALEIAYPKANGYMENHLRKLKNAKIKNAKWIKTYEDFKGAKLNFYCQKFDKLDSPVVSIGMTHRTKMGMILMTVDNSNGGIPIKGYHQNQRWTKWVRVFTGHFCERYAERIMKTEVHNFKTGSEGFMFADLFGPVRVIDNIADGVEEIEFQFKDGQAYGYRDSNSKISYFKTVYSNDMLKRDRLEFKKEWEHTLEELQEIFKWE